MPLVTGPLLVLMKYLGFISYGGARPHHPSNPHIPGNCHHRPLPQQVFQQGHRIQGDSFREPLPSTLDGDMACPQSCHLRTNSQTSSQKRLLVTHRPQHGTILVFVQFSHRSGLDGVHLPGVPRTLGTLISKCVCASETSTKHFGETSDYTRGSGELKRHG